MPRMSHWSIRSQVSFLQLLAGSSVTERQAVDAAEKVIEEAVGDKARGLTYKEYVKAMKAIPISMIADLNVESWIS